MSTYRDPEPVSRVDLDDLRDRVERLRTRVDRIDASPPTREPGWLSRTAGNVGAFVLFMAPVWVPLLIIIVSVVAAKSCDSINKATVERDRRCAIVCAAEGRAVAWVEEEADADALDARCACAPPRGERGDVVMRETRRDDPEERDR